MLLARLPIVDAPQASINAARAEVKGNDYLEACLDRILWSEWTIEIVVVCLENSRLRRAYRFIKAWV